MVCRWWRERDVAQWGARVGRWTKTDFLLVFIASATAKIVVPALACWAGSSLHVAGACDELIRALSPAAPVVPHVAPPRGLPGTGRPERQ